MDSIPIGKEQKKMNMSSVIKYLIGYQIHSEENIMFIV